MFESHLKSLSFCEKRVMLASLRLWQEAPPPPLLSPLPSPNQPTERATDGGGRGRRRSSRAEGRGARAAVSAAAAAAANMSGGIGDACPFDRNRRGRRGGGGGGGIWAGERKVSGSTVDTRQTTSLLPLLLSLSLNEQHAPPPSRPHLAAAAESIPGIAG